MSHLSIPQTLTLVDTQARMALRSDASRLWLGYVWWILEPLLYVAVFYLVFKVILGTPRGDFLLFLICGKLPFMWFSGSVNTAANSMRQAQGLIGQTRLPKVIFPLARVQEALYRQVAVFGLLIAAVLVSGRTPGLQWLWLLPIAATQYLLIVACAVGGALLVCVLRDFARLIQLATIFMLFVSGIFWDVRSLADDTAQRVLVANPLAFLIDAYRQVLMLGAAPDAWHLAVLAAVMALACVAIVALVGALDDWIAQRVLSQ